MHCVKYLRIMELCFESFNNIDFLKYYDCPNELLSMFESMV